MSDLEIALLLYFSFCIVSFVGCLLAASWLGKRLVRDTEEDNS